MTFINYNNTSLHIFFAVCRSLSPKAGHSPLDWRLALVIAWLANIFKNVCPSKLMALCELVYRLPLWICTERGAESHSCPPYSAPPPPGPSR